MSAIPAVLIVNPTAGRGKAGKSIGAIKDCLPTEKFDWSWEFTKARGDAEGIARNAIDGGAQLVVAVGGDGTLHEVVNGTIGTGTTVGLIPFGTGNDFARAIGVFGSLQQACRALVEGDDISVDIGCIEGDGTSGTRHFLVICGTGFDAKTAQTVNSGVRFVSGPMAYVYGALQTLKTFVPFELTLTLDDSEEIKTKSMFVSFANVATTGGGMLIAPGAQVNDGLLDICLVQETTKLALAFQLTQVFKGAHVKHPAVRMLRAKEILVNADPPQPLLIDGEVIGTTPAKISLLKNALCIKGFLSDNSPRS